MLRYHHILIFLWLFVFASGLSAMFGLQFHRVAEGIEEINYTCICQDKYGFMWLGSKNGLVRYDGYEMKKYRTHTLPRNNISANWITDIAEDSLGNLWIGTFDGGLNYFDRQEEKFYTYVQRVDDSMTLSSNTVLKLIRQLDGSVWIATAKGLNRILPDKRIIRYQIARDMYISAMAEDERGNLWLGTFGYGLFIFAPSSGKVIQLKNIPQNAQSLPDNNIRTLLRDSRGNMWIGFHQQGLWRVKTKSFPNFNFEKLSVPSSTILCLMEDSKGNIWIGTENGGLSIYYPRTQKMVTRYTVKFPEYYLPANSIWALYEDRTEAVWIATFNQGLYRYDPYYEKFPQPFEIQRLNHELEKTSVTSIFNSFPEILLLGTDGEGLYQWNAQTHELTKIDTRTNLSSNSILSIASDSKNLLYLGTWGGGVNIAKYQNHRLTITSQIFNYEHVFSSLYDSEGNVWIGTWGNGLHILRANGEVTNINAGDNENQISNPNIFHLFADSKGRVWVSTLVGLNLAVKQLDGQWIFKRFFHNPNDSTSLFSSTVLYVMEDQRRNLWIGTTSGLNRFDEKTGTMIQIKPANGLLNCEIKSIIDDDYGNLWIGSDIGLIQYMPKTNKVFFYDHTDGLPVSNFSIGAVARNEKDQLIFGGIHGIVIFHPDSIRVNPVIPKVFITEVKVFGRKLEEQQIIRNSLFTSVNLTYKDNAITITYVGLNNYSHPEKNRYSYLLQGVDHDWIDAGNQRSVTYSHLSPGKYTFMVKAANNDGLWNESPTILKIYIAPPFWKTLWFKIFVLALVLSSGYGYMRYLIRKSNEKLLLQKQKLQAIQVEKEKEIAQLQSSKLQQELEYRIKELETTTLHLIHKNEKFIELRDKLNEIIVASPSAIQRQLSQVVKLINQNLEDEQNWENFERHFNAIHDNFIRRFAEAYPDLTYNDLKLCALIRMNMSNKEIASFLNISVRSVESRRYRIRKRMGIDSDVNLNDYIIRF